MKRIALFLLLIFPCFLSAQNTMYFMDRLPQSISFNPAMVPDVKFYIGLPVLSGVSVNAFNDGFTFSEFKDFYNRIGQPDYNPDEFINSIGKYNNFYAEAQTNIFSTGFRIKEKNFFSLGVTLNNSTVVKAGSDIAYLLADLNDITTDDFPIRVENIDLLTNNYFSLGLTYSRKINQHLTLGITPHINFNLVGIKTNSISDVVTVEEFPDGEKEYTNTFYGDVIIGLPTKLNPNAVNGSELDLSEGLFPDNWLEDLTLHDVLLNKSLSLDIGANYTVKRFTFSASLLNIGASKWETNGYKLLGNNDKIRIVNEDKINIGIPAKIYIGGKHQFSKNWNYGFVFNSIFFNKGAVSSGTISLNGNFGNVLSTSVSYTAGFKFNNLGLGFKLRFLPGADLFFVTDNLIQSFSYKNAYRVSAAFGVNLTFGNSSNSNKKVIKT